jgi:hypothetical protein
VAGVIVDTAHRGEGSAELFDVPHFVMEPNRLHEFAGRRHGNLVATLWGYMRHSTAGACSALMPPLQGFLPFLAFFVAFGCHGAHVLSNGSRLSPAKRWICYRIDSVCHSLGVRPKKRQGVLLCMDDTLGRDVMANLCQR